jgi:hypothetical protein
MPDGFLDARFSYIEGRPGISDFDGKRNTGYFLFIVNFVILPTPKLMKRMHITIPLLFSEIDR